MQILSNKTGNRDIYQSGWHQLTKVYHVSHKISDKRRVSGFWQDKRHVCEHQLGPHDTNCTNSLHNTHKWWQVMHTKHCSRSCNHSGKRCKRLLYTSNFRTSYICLENWKCNMVHLYNYYVFEISVCDSGIACHDVEFEKHILKAIDDKKS